jgi:hypothetical protein
MWVLISDLVKAGKAVEKFIVKIADGAPAVVQEVTADVEKLAPVIEAFVPQSSTAFNLAMTMADKIGEAIEAAAPAALANGLNVSLNQAEVSAWQAVIAAAKAAAMKPAAPAAAK